MENKPLILAIDDDPIGLRMLKEHLDNLGYDCETARSGYEAWDLLRDNPNRYKAIIVDRMMEGIDGLELTRRMQAEPGLKDLPVIMQTGEAEPEEHIAAIKAGVFDFIYKPVEEKLLMYVVRNALQKDLLERQNDLFAEE